MSHSTATKNEKGLRPCPGTPGRSAHASARATAGTASAEPPLQVVADLDLYLAAKQGIPLRNLAARTAGPPVKEVGACLLLLGAGREPVKVVKLGDVDRVGAAP